jgi:signal transduction histidine kinase
MTADRVDTSGLQSLADVLGGPYAITVRGWLLLAPLSVAVMGLAALHAGDHVVPMVASAIAAQLTMLAVLLGVRAWLDRIQPADLARRVAVLAAFAVCGAIRTGASVAVAGETGPEAGAQAINALQTGVLVAIVALTLAALIVSQWERYAGRSRDLAVELARLDGLRAAASRSLADVDRTIEETVAAPLRRTLAAAEADLNADLASTDLASAGSAGTTRAEHLAALALDLRRIAADVVRPLSHDLAAGGAPVATATQPPSPSPIARATSFAGATFTVAPFQPALTVLVAAPLVAVIALQELHDPSTALGTALNIVVGVLLALAARRWLAAPIRTLPMVLRVIAVVAVWMVQAGVWVAIGWPFLHDLRTWPSFAAGGFSLPVLALFAAAGAAFADGRRTVEARLAATNAQVAAETAQLRREAAERRLALAHVLHGHVIGTLTSAAVLVGAAADDGDAAAVQEARAAVAEARAALADLTSLPVIGTDLEAILREHGRLWVGLLVVDVDVDAEVRTMSHDPGLLGAIDRLVGECLSGAVRYGHARYATVRVSIATPQPGAAASRVLLVVDSDGSQASAVPWPTGGSALFDQLALAWSRSSLPDGGSRMSLELAPGRSMGPDANS